jgi:AraC-like DNA-binding protein
MKDEQIWMNIETRQKLMSKKNIFSNEDVQTKMSILKLMSGLDELMNNQIQIMESKKFGNKGFLNNISKYIEKEDIDYQKYLQNVKKCLNQNKELLELKNKSNFIERELQRAFREEQKVNYKQKSLELKKEILSNTNAFSIDL